MTNYREILRLHSLGLNKTEIAASLHCVRNTVAVTLQRAGNCGLQWPLPDEMSDRQLAEMLFPSAPGKPVYKMPDYAYVYKEMQKSGVTLNLLWLEYCDQCKAAGEIPYQSTQFNKYYSDYLHKTNATMHLNGRPPITTVLETALYLHNSKWGAFLFFHGFCRRHHRTIHGCRLTLDDHTLYVNNVQLSAQLLRRCPQITRKIHTQKYKNVRKNIE